MLTRSLILMLGSIMLCAACTPTVKVQAPDKPIEINMNVKIDHHIRVELEKDVDELLSKNKDLF
jgi:hypothetical protein